MDEKITRLLFWTLGASLDKSQLDYSEKQLYTKEIICELLTLSKAHDMDHLAYTGLVENGLVSENDQGYKSTVFKAVYRCENQSYELGALRKLLEENKIPFIPLKGSILRDYYNEPWQRTSCDVDILVKKEDLEKATDAIVNTLGYSHEYDTTHDVSLMSPSGVHLELHFELNEENYRESPLLSDIWQSGELSKISEYEYSMSNELFLFFHIYHMAKHFEYGGCGIKPLMDLWIIKNKMSYDEKKTIKMLKKEGYYKFYEGALALVGAWFEGKEHTQLTKNMESYILDGGVYGTAEHNTAMVQGKEGRTGHLLKRIFMPYKKLKTSYPVLEKWPILYPLFVVVRWFRIIFSKDRKNAIDEIKQNQSLSKEKRSEAKALLNQLRL